MIKIINQMINNINKTIAILIAVVFLTPAVTFAEPSVSDSGSSAAAVTVSVPRVTDSGNSSVSVSVSTPSTTDSGNSAVSAPSTTDQGNSGTTASASTPSTTDQGNSAVSSSNTNTPSTTDQGNSAVSSNPNTGSSSNGGSSSNSGSSSNGGSRSKRGGKTSSVINSECPYITSYMKMGNSNDSAQVTKLQAFLKTNEKLNLDINGKFDQKTHDAVIAFQTKYANDILLPWGGAKATGHVFYTTQKKINELVCKKPVTLTSGQLKAIEAFKNGKNEEAVKAETANGDIIINSDSNSSSTPVVVPEVGKNTSTSDTQTASAVKVSVGSKVWSFVKWLFGYNK